MCTEQSERHARYPLAMSAAKRQWQVSIVAAIVITIIISIVVLVQRY